MLRVSVQTKRTLYSVDIITFIPSFRLKVRIIFFRCITDPSTPSSYRKYLKNKIKLQKIAPLDPFNLVKKSSTVVDREDGEFDTRIPLTVRESLKKYCISPKLVTTSALGNEEQRVLQLTHLVGQLSDQMTYLEQVDLYKVLLLKFSLVKLDLTKLVFTIKALIKNGLDPARMLERQPTVVSLDTNTLANNIESLLRIIKPERNELTFNFFLFHELKRLSGNAKCANRVMCEGVEIVNRLYQSGNLDELSELRVYRRVFKAIKRTVLAGEYTDTDVYKDCTAVYNRLIKVARTDLCSDHFKEVALGLNDKCLSDLKLLREDRLDNNRWVSKFLKDISATKILLSDYHWIQQLGSQLALLKEFGINVNKLNLHKKCPMLLNTSVNDIKKSMEILGSSPFYCNKNDICRVFIRDPSIFTAPAMLERSRQQLEQIPLLRQKQILWHNVVKQTPNVLRIRNYARIFKLFHANGFSNDEIITTLEFYPSILRLLEEKIEKLEREGSSYKPYISKIGLTTQIQFIKKRIAQEIAQRYHGYYDSELVSPGKEEYSDWGTDREDFSFETDRENEDIEDRLDSDDI